MITGHAVLGESFAAARKRRQFTAVPVSHCGPETRKGIAKATTGSRTSARRMTNLSAADKAECVFMEPIMNSIAKIRFHLYLKYRVTIP
jgi:hypothetical protein